MHHRTHPREHRFQYGIFLACLDLDELDRLDRRLRWFSRNRRNLFEFRDSDHFTGMDAPPQPRRGPDLRSRLVDWLAGQGVAVPDSARIRLLTFPRVLGYVFNPVSFYFVHGPDGEPITAVAEVGNTFGEQKPYRVPVTSEAGGSRFRLVAPKHFYVSPFSTLDLRFDFRLRSPDDRLAIAVDDLDPDGRKILVSTLTGERRPLSDAELLRLTLRYPLVTLRTITLIHWEALRLWLKRIPFHRKASHPQLQTGIHPIPHGTSRSR